MKSLYNGKKLGSVIYHERATDFSKVTAHPEFVLKGKTFHDETGQLKTGTAALSLTGVDTSDATATEDDVKEGVTFYANGEKKTGTMPDYHSGDFAIGYTNGDSGELKIGYSAAQKTYFNAANGALIDTIFDQNFVAGNIKKDTSIFGVVGTYEGEGGGSGGDLPKLYAPTVTASGLTLTIADDNNGSFARSYKVYADGVLVATTTSKTIDLNDHMDANKTFEASVIVTAAKFLDSDSTKITIIIAAGTAGLEYYDQRDAGWRVDGIGTATDTDIVIPPMIDGRAVTMINGSAFASTNITSVSIPDSVAWIGPNAFDKCASLAQVEGVNVKIQYRTFRNCTALKSITLGNQVTSIDSTAFVGSGLTDIYVPWAEGAVADAPWGADNATIHYNSEV